MYFLPSFVSGLKYGNKGKRKRKERKMKGKYFFSPLRAAYIVKVKGVGMRGKCEYIFLFLKCSCFKTVKRMEWVNASLLFIHLRLGLSRKRRRKGKEK